MCMEWKLRGYKYNFIEMKNDNKTENKQGRRKKVQLFKPRKKKSVEEDAAIQYLQGQYDKVL